MRCNDYLRTFKTLERFRVERSGSSRTDLLTLSNFYIILDNVSRPNFGFSSVVPVSSKFSSHFRISVMLDALFKWTDYRVLQNFLRATIAELQFLKSSRTHNAGLLTRHAP